jgi:hypothetical protein
VGPTAEGLIPAPSVERLQQIPPRHALGPGHPEVGVQGSHSLPARLRLAKDGKVPVPGLDPIVTAIVLQLDGPVQTS